MLVWASSQNGIKIIMGKTTNKIAQTFPNLAFFARRKFLDTRFWFVKNQEKYTINKYYKRFGVKLDLSNPETFYDKVNYLKLSFSSESSAILIDKDKVKSLLSSRGYNNQFPITIKCYSSYADFSKGIKDIIQEYNYFVIKLTHTSGDVFFYQNGVWKNKKGNSVSQKYVFGRLRQNLKFNYYHLNFEKVYENVEKKILIEEYIPSLNKNGIDELKLYVNYGKIIIANYVVDRQNGKAFKEIFMDENFNKYDVKQDKEIIESSSLSKPQYYGEIIRFCWEFCKDIPFVRVDFMVNKERFYFSEFTFSDCSGMNIFQPIEYNSIFGKMISFK